MGRSTSNAIRWRRVRPGVYVATVRRFSLDVELRIERRCGQCYGVRCSHTDYSLQVWGLAEAKRRAVELLE